MRKVILRIQVSLDGFVEGPNGEMDWLAHDDDEYWQDLFELLESVDTFLLGRVTYPDYAAYWGAVLTNPDSSKNQVRYARIAERTPHLVFSRTLKKVNANNTRIISGDLEGEVLDLKNQHGKDMVVWGGASLASAFVELGLVDEYQFALNPVVLGGGKALFKDVRRRRRLKLAGVRTLRSGVVLVRYTP